MLWNSQCAISFSGMYNRKLSNISLFLVGVVYLLVNYSGILVLQLPFNKVKDFGNYPKTGEWDMD